MAGHWKDDGLCAQIDPELWFPEKGHNAAQARRICFRCPVRPQCLTAGRYETLEKLEDAVDAFLWSEHDRLQNQELLSSPASRSTNSNEIRLHDALVEQGEAVRQISRARPR